MPHRIDPYNHHLAGETLVWEHTVEEDGSAKDLSGASVNYYLLAEQGDANDDALLDDSDADITAAIVDAANGRIDVTFASGATDPYAGQSLWQRLIVDDAAGDRSIWHGPLYVARP